MRNKEDEVLRLAEKIEPAIIGWRRAIHRYPELGMDTPRTAAFIEEELRNMGIEVRCIAGCGVIGTLRGACEGKTMAIRADIDGLPITEETGLPFASEIPGRMHACGHDAHAAIVLGAAMILSQLKKDLKGNVRFIFQPGEESSGGARVMIEEGALEDPKVDAIIAGHVGTLWPLESGQFGFKCGPFMAASDSFTITVKGKGGHGATPEQCVDPIVVAAQIILSMQAIVSRETKPVEPAVVTVGQVAAGSAHNIIPEKCVLRGTVRYFDKGLEQFLPRRIEEIAVGIARAMRADADVEYNLGYRPVINDEEITQFLEESARTIVGQEKVVDIQEPTMGAEDMSYYLEKVPGTFIGIGTANKEKGTAYPNHHPKFDVDEDVLHIASAVFARACIDYLSRN